MSVFCKLFVPFQQTPTVEEVPAHGGSYPLDPHPVDYRPLLDEMDACAEPLGKIQALSSWVFRHLALGWHKIKDAFHRAVSSVFDFLAKFFLSYNPDAPKELIKRTYQGVAPTLSFLQRFLLRLRTRIDPDSPLLVDVFFRALVGTRFMRLDDAEFASAIFMSLKEAAGSWRGFTWQGVKLAARGAREGFRSGLRRGVGREIKAIITVAAVAHTCLPPVARAAVISLGYDKQFLRSAILSTVQGGVSLLQTAAKGHSSLRFKVHAINSKATGLWQGALRNTAQGLQSALASLRPIPLVSPLVMKLALQSARVTRSTPSRLAFATSAICLGTLGTWRSVLWALYLFSVISSPSTFLLALANYVILESLETTARAYYTYTQRLASSN